MSKHIAPQKEKVTFTNAPLVELIAELRWGTPTMGYVSMQAEMPVYSGVSLTKHEELFEKFAGKISEDGYSQVERLLPVGFPIMPFQPVCRYRKIKDSTLYQLGPGIFSANITPPYQTWNNFRPIVKRGIEIFLESRGESEKNEPIRSASLRYIDAFKNNLTEGRSIGKFLSEILGFKIELPEILVAHAASMDDIQPQLRLSIPLKSKQLMTLNLAEGLINNSRAIILDTVVSSVSELPPEATAIMDSLDVAQKDIHVTFLGMTSKLEQLMKIKQE